MSGDTTKAKKAAIDARRKRVNRIKKIIILIVVIFLLLPSILCVSLWVKVLHLEQKLDQFVEDYTIEHKVSNEEVDNTVMAAEVGLEDVEKETVSEDEDQTKIEGKKVYLTFDDGPSRNTEKILDILAEYNVKATFFVIGQTDEHSKRMYQRINQEGHTLAMHSYTHQYKKIYKSVNAYKKDMDMLSNLLYDTTGTRPHFIRFPGGSSNTVSTVDMKKIIQYTKDAGYVYYDWNVINGDATGENLSKKQMIHNVVSGVEMYENSVVLMHDCVGKDLTVQTLPTVIEKLKKMGVTLLPINDTTVPVQHIKADDVK